jgi:hypothetical protein
MGGESVQDPQADLDDVQVAADDLDLINEIDSQDGGDDDDIERIVENFSGDSKALAKAYAHLQRKFGEQGREVGEMRGELRAAMALMTARTKDGDGQPADPREEFLTNLEAQVDKGEINLVDAFRKMLELSERGDGRGAHSAGTVDKEERAEIWEDFLEENRAAKQLEPLMGKIIREQPNLIRLDKGRRGLRKSLETVLELATSRYHRAKGSRGGSRRGGRMDSGQSRRVPRRTGGGGGRDGAPRFTNEQFNEAIDSARQGGSPKDWARPVGMILDTLEGFTPEED